MQFWKIVLKQYNGNNFIREFFLYFEVEILPIFGLIAQKIHNLYISYMLRIRVAVMYKFGYKLNKKFWVVLFKMFYKSLFFTAISFTFFCFKLNITFSQRIFTQCKIFFHCPLFSFFLRLASPIFITNHQTEHKRELEQNWVALLFAKVERLHIKIEIAQLFGVSIKVVHQIHGS